MIVKWEPAWYELDQSIVVGDVDLFYLSKNNLCFFNDLVHHGNNREVEAEILGISHSELGAVKGIITIGLDYTIYLYDGTEIIVNAEESPGDIQNSEYVVREWNFDVQIRLIKETDLSCEERLQMLTSYELKELQRERIKRYKALLGLTQANWDR